ncbi:MAG: transglutaminase domain-containing protein [Ignavibacteriae bacterium]|nr:transglutaminase domain-containing protein [Ignavibacteriota bacterium]
MKLHSTDFLKSKIALMALVFLTFACATSDQNISNSGDGSRINKVIDSVKDIAAGNKSEMDLLAKNCPENQKEGLQFLIENMPERDLKNLSADFLLQNLNYAYKVMDEVKWGKRIPKEIFLNYILPYANLHERRDNWRKDFYDQFLPLVKNLETPSEATLLLNDKLWDIVNVRYSTKRPKADQSPYESIDAGLASCTGLSILLIDVCRAVGIPARFVGVPLWKDHSGNHSWLEIWDNGWHYLGAFEKSPLNETWFGERAKTSDDSNWKYSIYANSFKKTDVIFPPLFDSTATYVYAEIVTDRYSANVNDEGKINLAVRLFDKQNGKRVIGDVTIKKDGEIIGSGKTKDEKRDYNDFLIFNVDPNSEVEIIADFNGKIKTEKMKLNDSKYQFINITLNN